MGSLLSYEYKKTFSTKAIYICSLLTFAFTILNGILSCHSTIPLGNEYLIGILSGCSLDLVLAILIPILFCSEMDNGCIKIMIGRGYTRKNILFSKIIMSNLYMIIIALASFLIGIAYGAIRSVNYNNITSKHILNAILEIGVYMIIVNCSIFFSVLTQSKAFAIAASIIVPALIPSILLLVEKLIKFNKLHDYWYVSFMESLGNNILKNSEYTRIFIFTLIYNAIFITLSYLIIKRKDF